MEQLRAFIALELPKTVTETLKRLVQQLRSLGIEEVRWTDPDGIHLTLKFLGNISSDSVTQVSRAVSRCAASVAPLDLFLKDLGAFPSLRDPRVIWVGLGGDLNALAALQTALEMEVEHLGFARERRPFSPHLTLGRTRNGISPPQRRKIGEAIGSVGMDVGGGLTVGEVNLMKSTLTPSGAVYTCLHSAPLGGHL